MDNLDRQTRKSGIELLKVLAIFLVVLGHVVQTLGSSGGVYQLKLSSATTDMTQLVLAILRYTGAFGNSIFFVCSAWFLLDAKKWNLKKLLYLWLQVWSVSMLIMVIVCSLGDMPFQKWIFFESLFSVIFGKNWYISCYIVFCLIAPLLNILLDSLTQRQLLSVCVMGMILCAIQFLFSGYASPFVINDLVRWCIIYFWIAYMKRYLPQWTINRKYGFTFTAIGLLGYVGMIVLANILGQKVIVFADSLTRWCGNSNLFLLLTAVGLFLLANQVDMRSRVINEISKLSLLVYIIHENFILRQYYRPKIFEWLYAVNGSENLVLWVLGFAAAIFIGSVVISYCYQKTICRLLKRVCDWVYPKLELGWNTLLDRLEK